MNPHLSLIEFLCNLRWILSYAVQRLDPVVEAHYAHVFERVQQTESALSRSCAAVNSLAQVSADALALAQEGIVYLLVAEGVLGHCPPTMHSFLLRATTTVDSGAFCASASSSCLSAVSQTHNARNMHQSQFLCIRWLVSEGLLTDEELLDALGDEIEKSTHETQSQFELHISMAKTLSCGFPFALQAHVLLTRSLILHHCCSLISVNDIIAHVRFLDPNCSGKLESIEDSLLFWIYHLLKVMHQKKMIDDYLYQFALKELKDSLYHSIQSGVVLTLAVNFYKPNLLPLNFSHTLSPDAYGKLTSKTQEDQLQRWGGVLRVSEELGLWPCLYVDEVVQYGDVVLQLQVLRFLEELFALLATQAEDLSEYEKGEREPSFNPSVILPSAVNERMEMNCLSVEQNTDSVVEPQVESVVNDSREKEIHVMESNDCHRKTQKNVSSMEEGSDASTRPLLSSSSCYPSAHSRRQYEVMMASLQLRGVSSAGVPDTKKSDISSVNPSCRSTLTSVKSGAVAVATGVVPVAVPSLTSSSNSSTGYLLPRGEAPQQRVKEGIITLPESIPDIEFTYFRMRCSDSVKENNDVNTKPTAMMNFSRSSFIVNEGDTVLSSKSPADLVTISAVTSTTATFRNDLKFSHPSPAGDNVMIASNRYNHTSSSHEKEWGSTTALPFQTVTTTSMTELHNDTRAKASCTSSESSFRINLLRKSEPTMQFEDEMKAHFSPVFSSSSYSRALGKEEVESDGLSPMTPDVANLSDVLSPKGLTTESN